MQGLALEFLSGCSWEGPWVCAVAPRSEIRRAQQQRGPFHGSEFAKVGSIFSHSAQVRGCPASYPGAPTTEGPFAQMSRAVRWRPRQMVVPLTYTCTDSRNLPFTSFYVGVKVNAVGVKVNVAAQWLWGVKVNMGG